MPFFFDAFKVKKSEVEKILEPRRDPEAGTRALLYIVGIILTPITLIGAIMGFKRAYWRFDDPLGLPPHLGKLRPITRVTMIAFAVLIWPVLYFLFMFLVQVVITIWPSAGYSNIPVYFVLLSFAITIIVMIYFLRWQAGIANYKAEVRRHGSARFARKSELEPYQKRKGFYIGGGDYYYNKAGHLLTVAGTRGGKGVNLILPNLLQPDLFNGSWVVIDPKGENAAVSARIQREAGRKVVLLNPWNMLELGAASYNPLDLLKHDRMNLADDVQLIAECLVPEYAGKSGSNGDHFDNRARAYIAGLLLHLTTVADEDRHLGTLWEWLRLDPEKWNKLLADMAVNDDPIVGKIVQASANEIISLKAQSDKEYGSIISSAQKWTDFLKSPAMQDSLQATKEFQSSDLQDGNTTVYVIIPADRLKTHNQWLRLVVSSLMRSIVRNPNKDVCFLLDEFYALGYLSEIDIALGSYAGYGIHVWAILQNLIQLNELYDKNWENFLSSCSVRHFFNVSDNFSAEYVSKMLGQTSIPTYSQTGDLSGASARALVTMDELRRSSDNLIYSVIDQLAPAQFLKVPYFQIGLSHDSNPYYKP